MVGDCCHSFQPENIMIATNTFSLRISHGSFAVITKKKFNYELTHQNKILETDAADCDKTTAIWHISKQAITWVKKKLDSNSGTKFNEQTRFKQTDRFSHTKHRLKKRMPFKKIKNTVTQSLIKNTCCCSYLPLNFTFTFNGRC